MVTFRPSSPSGHEFEFWVWYFEFLISGVVPCGGRGARVRTSHFEFWIYNFPGEWGKPGANLNFLISEFGNLKLEFRKALQSVAQVFDRFVKALMFYTVFIWFWRHCQTLRKRIEPQIRGTPHPQRMQRNRFSPCRLRLPLGKIDHRNCKPLLHCSSTV